MYVCMCMRWECVCMYKGWTLGVSIPLPPACEAGALPFELNARHVHHTIHSLHTNILDNMQHNTQPSHQHTTHYKPHTKHIHHDTCTIHVYYTHTDAINRRTATRLCARTHPRTHTHTHERSPLSSRLSLSLRTDNDDTATRRQRNRRAMRSTRQQRQVCVVATADRDKVEHRASEQGGLGAPL